MAIPLEKIYDVFYSRVTIDFERNPYLDVNEEDNIVVSYLEQALYEYEENLGKTLTIDHLNEVIVDDIPNSHINILGKLVYKVYLERELQQSMRIASNFNKKGELAVTGLPTKINALREQVAEIKHELNGSFTKNLLKGL